MAGTGTCKACAPMAEYCIRLINKYRQCGMTDVDWCREKNIVVSKLITGAADAKAVVDWISVENYG